MISDRSYYERLKRRYLAADKAYWDNPNRAGTKDGDDILMEETPSDPSELRQYIEVISVFADKIDYDTLKALYQESINLLEFWEGKHLGSLDLKQARAKVKVLKKHIRKNKMEIAPAIIISIVMLGGFIAALIIFPRFANLMKKVFLFEYIKSLINYLISLFTL